MAGYFSAESRCPCTSCSGSTTCWVPRVLFHEHPETADEQHYQGVESTSGPRELTECVAGRRAELKAGLLDATHNISDVRLGDFNWVLKLALSSDRLACLQTPLLSLGLNVEGPGVDGYRDQVSLEMGRAELQSLVSTLEQASKVVQQTK
uniref:COMM domain-containing protein 8 isoform X3 n=1 Tax=Myxine glutinosa TaxID=7769 RepID=UPI00358EB58B